MFAALLVVRFRAAVASRGGGGLAVTKSWVSPDGVDALELPLAEAVELVLASMHGVLLKTESARYRALEEEGMRAGVTELEGESKKRARLRMTKAVEIRVVESLAELRDPEVLWKARKVGVGGGEGRDE